MEFLLKAVLWVIGRHFKYFQYAEVRTRERILEFSFSPGSCWISLFRHYKLLSGSVRELSYSDRFKFIIIYNTSLYEWIAYTNTFIRLRLSFCSWQHLRRCWGWKRFQDYGSKGNLYSCNSTNELLVSQIWESANCSLIAPIDFEMSRG